MKYKTPMTTAIGVSNNKKSLAEKCSAKDEYMIRGATLVHGNDAVRLAEYQHTPGN